MARPTSNLSATVAIITDNSDENSHGNICSKMLTAENMESSKQFAGIGSEYFKINETEDDILTKLCRQMEFFLECPITF
jgi:hypothetical protein